MNTRRVLTCLASATALLVSTARSCLNSYEEVGLNILRSWSTRIAVGNVEYWSYQRGMTREEREAVRAARARILRMWREKPSSRTFESRTDYAVASILLGQYRPAITLLRQLEAERPEEYSTAANLGTAYELAGEIDSAYQWIAEDMRRNPQGHEGSEWIHLKVLDAKRSLRADPHWLDSHSVLGLDFGPPSQRRLPPGLSLDSLRRVYTALHRQLHERAPFVRGRDPIVADLLGDYATIALLLHSGIDASSIYELALELGHPRPETVRQRLAGAHVLQLASADGQPADTGHSSRASEGIWERVRGTHADGDTVAGSRLTHAFSDIESPMIALMIMILLGGGVLVLAYAGRYSA